MPRKGGNRRSGPNATINNFIIAVLDDCLQPRFIGHIPARVAKQFTRQDTYQGSNKPNICEGLVLHPQMRVLSGDARSLCE